MKFGGNYRDERWSRVDDNGTELLVHVVVDDEQITLTHEAFSLLMERAGFTRETSR